MEIESVYILLHPTFFYVSNYI